ncbi:MAG: hypothetical protein J6D29_01275 [Solobacterium sp.]|nr:hypothetical protein [Solobacterium sp.]
MNSFYTEEELKTLGLKKVGEDVSISRKCSIYSPENIIIGNHTRIDDFCILSGTITIKDHVHIAAFSAIYGGEEGVYIDDYANISSRVSIYSISDDYSGETMTNPTIPAEYKNVKSAPVKIEKHVIIGATSVVLPGVTLKEGSAFGSFSFINKDSLPWSINAGIPCEYKKERSKKLLENIFED